MLSGKNITFFFFFNLALRNSSETNTKRNSPVQSDFGQVQNARINTGYDNSIWLTMYMHYCFWISIQSVFQPEDYFALFCTKMGHVLKTFCAGGKSCWQDFFFIAGFICWVGKLAPDNYILLLTLPCKFLKDFNQTIQRLFSNSSVPLRCST